MLLSLLLAASADYVQEVLEDRASSRLRFRLGVPHRPRRRPLSGLEQQALEIGRHAWRELGQRGVRVPALTGALDSGMQGGFVFRTTDPLVVVRVGLHPRGNRYEALFCEDEDLAPGLCRCHGQWWSASGKTSVTWKERVDPDVTRFLIRLRLPEAQEREVILALNRLYDVDKASLRVLASFEPTAGLSRAIRNGLRTEDLALDSNLGVTKDGRIVAFDL